MQRIQLNLQLKNEQLSAFNNPVYALTEHCIFRQALKVIITIKGGKCSHTYTHNVTSLPGGLCLSGCFIRAALLNISSSLMMRLKIKLLSVNSV